jgi:archaetidylinositol phosphate synthase
MSKRVSHSLLDPYVGPPLKALYRVLPIPRWFPPEGIILCGHLSAIAAAIGFALSTSYWWGGVLAAVGVLGNHTADCIDGTHARATGQCRNGGELLDHFTDPLSFSYWLVGLAVSCGRLDYGLAAVILLYATAVLTSIKAKMIGEFTLASFGPTEFKALLTLYGLAIAAHLIVDPAYIDAQAVALWFLRILILIGISQLIVNLITSVRQVNRDGDPPDTTEWQNRK